jgi:hypothetical protein
MKGYSVFSIRGISNQDFNTIAEYTNKDWAKGFTSNRARFQQWIF